VAPRNPVHILIAAGTVHASRFWLSRLSRRRTFVDHSVTDQSSILRFIEDNWNLGRIGDQSFDALAGSLGNMFNFASADNDKLILDDQTGEPVH